MRQPSLDFTGVSTQQLRAQLARNPRLTPAALLTAPAKATAPRKPRKVAAPVVPPPGPRFHMEGDVLVVRLDVRTENEANRMHTKWGIASYRTRIHKQVRLQMLGVPRVALPVDVTLTRHSAGSPDGHDGLRNTQKTTIDELAKWLGLPLNKKGHAQDNDPRVSWKVEAAKSKPGVHFVMVRFEPRKDGAK